MRLRLVSSLLLFAAACGGSSDGSTQPAPVATVTVTLESISVGAGLTTNATAVLRDASGSVLTGRTVTWSSSATSTATVSPTGAVTALAQGAAIITATSEGKTGAATLTVTGNPVETVTVTLASSDLTQGDSTQATATLRDAGGNVLTGRTVIWSSAVPTIASVSATGVVTGVGAGAVLVTATSEGKSGSAAVTVTAVTVASVTVELSPPLIGVGARSQALAVVRDPGGNILSGNSITWTSSDPAVANFPTLSPPGSGVLTGAGPGTATITATAGGVSGAATITVSALVPVTALGQTAPPGAAVVQPPAVRVTDGSGNPRSGVSVNFAVTAGGGSVVGSPAVTDASGVARLASWTFGPAGAQSVSASTGSVPGATVEFAGLSRPPSGGYDITLRLVTPMTDAQLRAFVDAKERIQEFVTGEIADQLVNVSLQQMIAGCGVHVPLDETVDDVLIFAEISTIDGVGNILGQAGPCFLRGATGFPAVGTMQFDILDVPSLESGGALEATVLHEMMHVLGFGTMWPDRGLLAGSTTTTPSFTGAAARSAFVTYNGGGTYPNAPVPVEGSTGSAGTDDAHWRESDFDDELMTGFLDRNVPEVVSATTIASMQDLGYVVALSRADPFRWGSATVALRNAAALRAVEPPFQMVDDVRRQPPVVLGPDGRPLFP